MGLGDFVKGAVANQKAKAEQERARQEQAEIAKAQREAAARAVVVSTGDIQAKYQPIKIVFAVGDSTNGFWGAKLASPQEAFERAVYSLQLSAVDVGGHAVVHCTFGYSVTQNGFIVHGYGTVVRLG